MKLPAALLVTLVAALSFSDTAGATLPAPRYVKKAVYVRMHWDRTFYEYWSGPPNRLSVAQMNDMLTSYFNDAAAQYKASAQLHNVDLFLLDDFRRDTGPMADYRDSAPQVGGDTRLIDAMHQRLQTGPVNKTVPNGTTYLLGRTVNWVFVHGNFGRLAGKADSIRGLSTTDANIYVSTATGDLTDGQGMYHPLVEQRRDIVLENLMHETGHLFGGEHTGLHTNNELADCPFGHYEIMCQGFTPLERRFGPANFTRVEGVMKNTLQRCSSTFSSVSSCQNAVSEECSRILDYTLIQGCIDANILSSCSDICTSTQKSARVVINSINSPIPANTVSAAGPKQ